MVRQWARCLSSKRSVSLRETRLILVFQSRRSSQYALSPTQFSSVRSGNQRARVSQGSSLESGISSDPLLDDYRGSFLTKSSICLAWQRKSSSLSRGRGAGAVAFGLGGIG